VSFASFQRLTNDCNVVGDLSTLEQARARMVLSHYHVARDDETWAAICAMYAPNYYQFDSLSWMDAAAFRRRLVKGENFGSIREFRVFAYVLRNAVITAAGSDSREGQWEALCH
jgi:hypothetical protein